MTQPLADRYQFEAEIARGAAGVVHRARDLITGESVAVKVLHAEAAGEPVMAAAFLDEAEVLSELNSPGIVRPRDLIVDGTVMALVMDLVEGVDLRRALIDEGPLSPSAAATAAAQLAQTLSLIHSAGIVHGDVKPGNILIPRDGSQVRLVDFGVARRIASPEAATHGTPDYAAPEIIEGMPTSAKSDVYGFGLVLFEMLCARNPYRGGSIDDVLERHRTHIPERPGHVPAELWSIIEPCLAADPAHRPEAGALPSMLRAVTPHLSTTPGPALMEPPVLRPRGDEAVTRVVGGVGVPVEMSPPDDAPFLPTGDSATRRRNPLVLVAGIVGGVVALGAAAAIGWSLLGTAEPGVVSEPTGVDESAETDPSEPEPDTGDSPSPDSDEEDAEPSQTPDDSTPDSGTDGDAGDGSDSGESEQDIPGGDLIGEPMPGKTGGN
ncbi:serine/threonine-protein kinase [Stackebrandtia albiflava]|uniref:non-specific serine/threonine protein kinase n=1 Tax=Stackebrandtia albiflava TaxID=406432 RepID=A0A562V4N0_9ACTN|nr:serine/threonine-protein kinase [Stackebrandtia albiflava]TWJ12851.1 serine/threonine-protein kinase [Stackebrandtia albiflava]